MDAKTLYAVSLPGEEWAYLADLVLSAHAPHQPRTKIMAAVEAQLKAQVQRTAEQDAPQAPADPPPAPATAKRQRKPRAR